MEEIKVSEATKILQRGRGRPKKILPKKILNDEKNEDDSNTKILKENFCKNIPHIKQATLLEYIKRLKRFNKSENVNIICQKDIEDNFSTMLPKLNNNIVSTMMGLCDFKTRIKLTKEFKGYRKKHIKTEIYQGKIYKLSNPSIAEIYVGSTILDMKVRLATHKHVNSKCKSRKLFEKNPNDVIVEILEQKQCTKSELKLIENKWIKQMSLTNVLLNKNKAYVSTEEKIEQLQENSNKHTKCPCCNKSLRVVSLMSHMEISHPEKVEQQKVKDAVDMLLKIMNDSKKVNEYKDEILLLTSTLQTSLRL